MFYIKKSLSYETVLQFSCRALHLLQIIIRELVYIKNLILNYVCYVYISMYAMLSSFHYDAKLIDKTFWEVTVLRATKINSAQYMYVFRMDSFNKIMSKEYWLASCRKFSSKFDTSVSK